MDAERVRELMLALPHVTETRQWGDDLLFWVGDKAIGGKMCAVVNLGSGGQAVISFAAGAERFAELVEREGLFPAPYMARNFWVAAQRWSALRQQEWEEVLGAAHELTLAKLPKRTRDVLGMPARERNRLIAERKKLLASSVAAKAASKR